MSYLRHLPEIIDTAAATVAVDMLLAPVMIRNPLWMSAVTVFVLLWMSKKLKSLAK
jgi:hypothetical protein